LAGPIRPVDQALPPASALIEQQRCLAERVVVEDDLPATIRTVAGADAAFPDGGQTTRAAVVLMTYPDLETLDEAVAEQPTRLPYIPGLLSFRELPAILAALEQLSSVPDLVLCDGQGIAHPRRFGVACHLGVTTGLCTIGIGKSRLCGRAREPGRLRGEFSPLRDGEETIGRVLRTRSGVRPLFISSGHRISLETAARLTLECTPRFRLPEPIRAADRLAGRR
jgi:deoxyribonuclease V